MVKTSNESKVQYVAPSAKLFEVRVRKGVLEGSNFNSQNGTEYFGYDDDEDL